jgi:hypothetical protein
MLGGVPFVAKSVIAFAIRDSDHGLDKIYSMEFFPDAGVTCKTRLKETASLDIKDFKGATTEWAPLKTAEPAATEHDLRTINDASVSVTSSSLGRNAWISFDAIGFELGDTVSGTAAIVNTEKDPSKAVNVGGHFTATVCH